MGNVRMKADKNRTGTCGKATYEAASEVLTLEDNPILMEGPNTIQGEVRQTLHQGKPQRGARRRQETGRGHLHDPGQTAGPAPMITLSGANRTKRYGARDVVRDIDLSVTQGEVVGVLSPNGAGKTTTFYMLAGIIRPTAGSRWTRTTSPPGPCYKRPRPA